MANIKLIGMNGHRIVPVHGGYRMDGKVTSLAEAVNAARHEDCLPPLTDEEMKDVKDAYEDAAIERGRNRKTQRHD